MIYQKSVAKINLLLLVVIRSLIAINPAGSQNLILNSGFEDHMQITRASYASNEIRYGIKKWLPEGFGHTMFDTRYQPQKGEIERGYDLKKFRPHTGHSMIELLYFSRTSGSPEGGGGAYLQAALTEPLDTHNIYNVSFWVFMPPCDGFDLHPDLPKYFGITLGEQSFYFSDVHRVARSNHALTIDSIQKNIWYRVEYNIKPGKRYNHLMIGVFQNPLNPFILANGPQTFIYHFFIDDVEIKQIAWNNMDKPVIKYPLESLSGIADTESKVTHDEIKDTWVVYFSTASDSLSSAARMVLDSVARQMKLDTTIIYDVLGYTDMVGSNHLFLSEKRALSVERYLSQANHSHKFRLLAKGMGVHDTVNTKRTEERRKMDRKVVIRRSAVSYAQHLYHTASRAVAKGQFDSAFHYFNRWIACSNTDPILLLHDPELIPLRSLSKWKDMNALIKKHYRRYPMSAYAFNLDNLYCLDQYYRSLSYDYKKSKGYIPLILDTLHFLNLDVVTRPLDSLHLQQLIELLDREGWPLASQVGKRAASAAAYIVIHSRKADVMKKYIPILEKVCQKGEGKWSDYANLVDRYLVDTGKKQLYGTQYIANPADPYSFELSPLEEPEQVNERRAKINLSPIGLSTFTVIKKN